VHGPGIDNVLGQVSTTSQVRTLWRDGTRNVARTPLNTGTAGLRRYEAFGALRSTNPPPVERGFAGRPVEGLSGLVNVRARHYDPATGRFLQPDPLGVAADQLYAYAASDPYRFWDPTGLQPSRLSEPEFFDVPQSKGAGVVQIGLFIANPLVAWLGNGDARDFQVVAGPSEYRVFIELNFESGRGSIQANSSCALVFICLPAMPFDGNPNFYSVSIGAQRDLSITLHAANSLDQGLIFGSIDSTFRIRPNGPEFATGHAILEPFPSVEIRQIQGERVTSLLQYREDPAFSGAIELLGIPNLYGRQQTREFDARVIR
jgi:RHS repeat-associated protein